MQKLATIDLLSIPNANFCQTIVHFRSSEYVVARKMSSHEILSLLHDSIKLFSFFCLGIHRFQQLATSPKTPFLKKLTDSFQNAQLLPNAFQ